MKICLIMIGEYSSRSTVAVFSEDNLEQAKQIAEWIGGDVEEGWVVNEFDYEQPPKGMSYFELEMCKDGKVVRSYTGSILTDGYRDGDEGGKCHDEHYILIDGTHKYAFRRSHWRLHVCCYAKTEKHAVKIANDIRVRILAGGLPKEGPMGIRTEEQ